MGSEMCIRDRLIEEGLSGVEIRPIRFKPIKSKFSGEECFGIQFEVVDRNQFSPFELAFHLLTYLKQRHAEECWFKEKIDVLLKTEGDLGLLLHEAVDEFMRRRMNVLLY